MVKKAGPSILKPRSSTSYPLISSKLRPLICRVRTVTSVMTLAPSYCSGASLGPGLSGRILCPQD